MRRTKNMVKSNNINMEDNGMTTISNTTRGRYVVFKDKYRIDVIDKCDIDSMLCKINAVENIIGQISKYCETLLEIEVPHERIHKYLLIVSKIRDYGFEILDLKSMINQVYNFAEDNDIYIIDLDISDSSINDKCIFFDASIIVRKNNIKAKIHLRLNYYKGKTQFIESSLYTDYAYNCYTTTFNGLKMAINRWIETTQED